MAVIINGETVDEEQVAAEVERLRPHYEQYVQENDGEGSDEQLAEWARENVIERTIVLQEARNRPIEIPAEEIDGAYEQIKDQLADDADAQAVKDDIELRMKVDRMMGQVTEAVEAPSDEEIQAFYDGHVEELTAPEQVHASHIVKHVDGFTDKEVAYAEISALKAELDTGTTFEELAARSSDCPGNSGDLGWFPRGQMVPEFEDIVFNMEVGAVSDIFLTSFGYHIVKLLERSGGEVTPLEEVRDHIAEELLDQHRAKAVEGFVDKLKSGAVIEGLDA